jgi:hypothetical protein
MDPNKVRETKREEMVRKMLSGPIPVEFHTVLRLGFEATFDAGWLECAKQVMKSI